VKKPKTFPAKHENKTVLAVCSVDEEGKVFVKYLVACSQEEVHKDFFASYSSLLLEQKIEDWCEDNGFVLWSY